MNNYKTDYSEMIQTTNIFDNNLVSVTSGPPGLGRLAFSTHCIAWQQESWLVPSVKSSLKSHHGAGDPHYG